MLIVQLLLPPSAPPSEPPGLAPRRQRPIMVPPVQEYAAILASPIFAPDRRPASADNPSGDGAGSASLAGYAAIGGVGGRDVATAVVTLPGGGVKNLRRGETVEGWKMIGVDRTHVYFERAGVRHALTIGAPPEAVAAPASPAASPQAFNDIIDNRASAAHA
jgi:hypothetical protein